VHVESIERFGSDQKVHPLGDTGFLADTQVEVLICKAAIVCDALANAIGEVERGRLKSRRVEQGFVGVEAAEALQERAFTRQYSRGLWCKLKPTVRSVELRLVE